MKRDILLNGEKVSFDVSARSADKVNLTWQGQEYSFQLLDRRGHLVVLRDQNGAIHRLQWDTDGIRGAGLDALMSSDSTRTAKKASTGSLISPMPGKVFKVMTKVGDEVKAGQTLMILEAMKMEHPIKSPKDGKIKKIHHAEGAQVQGGVALVELE